MTHVVLIIYLPVQAEECSFVGFQGEPWLCCHIDDLRPSENGAITVEGADGVPISKLFYGALDNIDEKRDDKGDIESLLCIDIEDEEDKESSSCMKKLRRSEDQKNGRSDLSRSLFDNTRKTLTIDHHSWKGMMCTQCTRLNSCIQAAASHLQDYNQNRERAAMRVKLLINAIPPNPVFPLGWYMKPIYLHLHLTQCHNYTGIHINVFVTVFSL